MKKAITLFLAVCLFLNVGIINAIAIDDSPDIITFDEFYSALKSEFAVYGIEWEAVQTDLSFVYTQAILNEELIKVRQFGEAYQASLESVKQEPEVISNTNDYLETPLRSPIYATITRYIDREFFLPLSTTPPLFLPGSGTMRITAGIQVDGQYQQIIKGNQPTLELRSGTYIGDYVKLKSYSYTYNNSPAPANRSATVTVICEVKQEYSIPGGSSWAIVETSIVATFLPFKPQIEF